MCMVMTKQFVFIIVAMHLTNLYFKVVHLSSHRYDCNEPRMFVAKRWVDACQIRFAAGARRDSRASPACGPSPRFSASTDFVMASRCSATTGFITPDVID